jgi:hypothetical protein
MTIPRTMRASLTTFAGIAMMAAAPHAAAQDSSSTTFFADGQRLMAAGKYAEACPRFEKALALNPGAGTKFNLADCYEKTGRLATAITLFREVESVTRQVGQQERSALAKQRADSLETRVPTVVVRAPWLSSQPRTAVLLDGRPLTMNDIEKPIRVDFGAHEAVARLDGVETRAQATLDKEGDSKPLVLEPPRGAAQVAAPAPYVAPVTPPPVAEPPAEPSSHPGRSQRIVGLVTGGAGVALLGVGAFLALSAKSDYDDATTLCGVTCPREETLRANDARDQANVGGVVGGIGLAALISGGILFFTAPSGVRLSPGAARSPAGLTFTGAF